MDYGKYLNACGKAYTGKKMLIYPSSSMIWYIYQIDIKYVSHFKLRTIIILA